MERSGAHWNGARRSCVGGYRRRMPTAGEKRALIFLASVAALGVAVRGWQSREQATGPGGDRAGLARQIGLVDSAIASGGVRKPSRRKRTAVDTASALAEQDAPVMPSSPRRSRAKKAQSAPPAGAPVDNRARYFAQREGEDSARRQLAERSMDGSRRRARRSGGTARSWANADVAAPVDLDLAPEEEIATVRGIGAALARRIVADRVAHGPFGSLDELQRVRGIGAALARRIAAGVTFSQPPVTARAPERAVEGGTPRARRRTPRPEP